MNYLKIGIDIDNTIADSFPSYVAKFNEHFGMNVKIDDISDFYYLEKNTGVSREQMSEFFDISVHREEFQMTINPIAEAKEFIKQWAKEGYFIHYITARPVSIRNGTMKWLEKHAYWVEGATLDLHDTDGESDIHYKKRIVEKLGIEVFIEDKKDIALAMTIPVYLLDRKWNQGKLPKHVTRVKNWEEIDRFMKQAS